VPRWEHRMDDGAARLPLRQDMDKTPGADVFPDHNTRKLHDANAGQRSLTQHPNVVRDKAGAMRDRRRLPVLMLELPLMIAVPRDRGWEARSEVLALWTGQRQGGLLRLPWSFRFRSKNGHAADITAMTESNRQRSYAGPRSRSAAVSCRTEVCYPFCRKHERGSAERWNVKYSTSTLNGLRRSGVCLRLYRRRFPFTCGNARLRFRLYRISRLSHRRGELDCMLRPVPLRPSTVPPTIAWPPQSKTTTPAFIQSPRQ
jgi:hypothetical protein